MKRLHFTLGLLLLAITGTGRAAEAPPLRVMPLGDSLTVGYSVPTYLSGYRELLYALLVDAGYNVDYLGTQTDTLNSLIPDPQHEGHGGWRIDQIRSSVDGWLTAVGNPDAILLCIGTNDIYQDYQVATAPDRLEELVDHLAVARPQAKIFVGNLLRRTDDAQKDAQHTAFNSAIPGIVSRQVALGHQVYLVDLHSSVAPADFSSDGFHPNQAGYDNMADTWFPAVNAAIAPDASAPTIISATSAGSEYVSIIFSKPLEDAATTLSHFGLSGGLTVLDAVLDPTLKRIITLRTSPQTLNATYTVTVTGVRDRTPAHTPIAPGTTASFQYTTVANGSFESDYVGWTRSGNQTVANYAPYQTTDGTKVAVFNGGNSTPNGVLAQTFETTPGQTYVLEFDFGVLAYNKNQQRLQIDLQGSSALLSQTATITGLGGGATRWSAATYNFTANSTTTTLTFRDTSTTTNALDLLLDHVRVNPLNIPPVTRTLTVASSPNSAVTITVSPADNNAASSGSTNFSRVYNDGTSVTLTAPATAGGNTFAKWQKNGADFSTNATITVTLDGDHTFTALYTTPPAGSFVNGSFESDYTGWTSSGNQAIANFAPYQTTDGAKVVVFNWGQSTPNGVLTQTFATTAGRSYVLQFDVGVLAYNKNTQRLQVSAQGTGALLNQTVSVVGLGGGATRWVAGNFFFTADSSATTLTFQDVSTNTQSIDMLLDNVRITEQATHTLTIASSPNSAVSVTVSPADTNGATTGSTSFTRVYTLGTAVTLTAPATAGGNLFAKWQRDSVDFSTSASINFTVDGDHAFTAVYTVPAGSFTNGSFESGYTGWTASGNQAVADFAPYPSTDGANVVVFNWGQSTPNAVLTQSLTTTPGQSYTLRFDVGAFAYNRNAQRLRTTVTGAAPLLDQTVSVTGLGGGATSWVAATFTFVADSTNTTLTFRDTSTTTNSIDMLLDNVRLE